MAIPPFTEMSGYPKIKRTWGSYEPVRRVKCAWDDADAIVDGFFFDEAYCRWPYKNLNVYAYEASIEPLPKSRLGNNGSGLATYASAVVTVYYSNKAVNATAFISERITPRQETLSLPAHGLQYADGSAVEGNITFTEPQLQYEITYHKAASVVLGNSQGCVNAAATSTRVLSYTFPAETMLSSGPILERALTPSGVTNYKETLVFTICSLRGGYGWNAEWNPNAGGWSYLQLAGTPVRKHPAMTFTL